jgi:uncharacterized membrane protein
VTTARLEAFSDGVFAIAITLLVLEFGISEDTQDLGAALLHIWPSYLAYTTTFLTIGVIWVNHHQLFDLVDHVDRPLLFFNTLLLMVVAFLPFPTRLVAQFLRGGDEQTATLAYGCTFIVLALAFQLVWRWMSTGRRLIREDVPQTMLDGINRSFNPGFPLYLGVTALAFVSPLTSIILFLALAVFYALPASLLVRRR